MPESLYAQLKRFLVETNAMSLALGVVIGGAVGKLVSSLVDGLIMPVVSLMLPPGDWRAWSIVMRQAERGPDGTEIAAAKAIAAGQILGTTLDFLIISLVVFVVAQKLLKIEVKK